MKNPAAKLLGPRLASGHLIFLGSVSERLFGQSNAEPYAESIQALADQLSARFFDPLIGKKYAEMLPDESCGGSIRWSFRSKGHRAASDRRSASRVEGWPSQSASVRRRTGFRRSSDARASGTTTARWRTPGWAGGIARSGASTPTASSRPAERGGNQMDCRRGCL